MAQWSKATSDQEWEKNFVQVGKFRTSCCSRFVVKFWCQFYLLHRHRKIHQVHFQVQQQSEVMIKHQKKTRANHQKPKTKTKRDNNRASEQLLRNLPDWVKVFAENLEDAEVLAPAHDFDSERPTKVARKKSVEIAKYACERR